MPRARRNGAAANQPFGDSDFKRFRLSASPPRISTFSPIDDSAFAAMTKSEK
jgi:hypothetical protein